jgi:hypothetical protein
MPDGVERGRLMAKEGEGQIRVTRRGGIDGRRDSRHKEGWQNLL